MKAHSAKQLKVSAACAARTVAQSKAAITQLLSAEQVINSAACAAITLVQ